MINLTQIGLQSDRLSWPKRLQYLLDPDIYLAENVGDIKDNADSITEFPWYKRLREPGEPRIYIIVKNVGITVLPGQGDCEEACDPDTFRLHNDGREMIVFWAKHRPWLGAKISFQEARRQQGLTDDDFVYEVFLRRFLKDGITHIVDITKHPQKPKPKKEAAPVKTKQVIKLRPGFGF